MKSPARFKIAEPLLFLTCGKVGSCEQNLTQQSGDCYNVSGVCALYPADFQRESPAACDFMADLGHFNVSDFYCPTA